MSTIWKHYSRPNNQLSKAFSSHLSASSKWKHISVHQSLPAPMKTLFSNSQFTVDQNYDFFYVCKGDKGKKLGSFWKIVSLRFFFKFFLLVFLVCVFVLLGSFSAINSLNRHFSLIAFCVMSTEMKTSEVLENNGILLYAGEIQWQILRNEMRKNLLWRKKKRRKELMRLGRRRNTM